ncbi:MAG: hypothetical protein WC455_14185 [Dehalococcoidia bacterium]|jgi:hypothetical protein
MATKVASLYAEIGADTSGLKKGLKEAQGGLKDTAKGADGIGTSLKGLVGKATLVAGAFAAVGAAAKLAFDFGAEGAQLEYAAGKFDRLTASIGTTSDILMGDLREATRGTLSDAKLMAGAGDLMALGLANSHDEVVRLSKVVGGLGMDMNQLVLTLTNQTTMRFDALGVSVDGFDAKVEKLKKSGLDANAAFKEAFLQQAEAQLLKVGDKAETGAGKIMQMEASFANLADTLKMKVAPAAVGFAEFVNDMLTNGGASKASIDSQAEAVGELTGTYEEYVEQLAKVAREQGYTVRYIDGTLRILNSSGMEVSGTFDEMTRTSYTLEKSLLSSNAAADEQAAIMGGLSGAASDAATEVNALASATAIAAGIEGDFADATAEAAKQLIFKKASADLDAKATRALAEAMGIWNQESFDVITGLESIRAKLDSGRITSDQYTASVANFTAAWNALNSLGQVKDFMIRVALETSERVSAWGGETNPYAPQTKPSKTTPQGTGKAAGGYVSSNTAYVVGERGPELFVPGSSGNIVPNHALGGGDVYNNIVVNTLPGQDENAIAAKVYAMLSRANRRGSAGLGYAGV